MDNATGKTLHRSLKDISNYKLNPEFKDQNLNQQAGYSAEIASTAKKNAENIINKDNTRYSRTDDLGKVNDPFVDIVSTNGETIQMKMVGANPQGCLDTLAKSDYEKYLNSDSVSKIDIPKDYYNDVKQLCQNKVDSLTNQIETMKEKGVDPQAIEKAQKQLEKYKLIKEKVSPSEFEKQEAIEIRLYPTKYTAKQIMQISHRAGMQGATFGTGIGVAVSVVKNIFLVCKDEKDIKEALKDVSFDAVKAGVLGYTTGFSGAAISACMQNSTSHLTRALGKSSLPSMIVTVSLEITKSFYSYFKGDITAVQLAENLGEKGVGLTNSALFAATAQAVIPIPIVGAAIGGMVGYMLSSIFYQDVMSSLKEAKIKRIERIRIETQCEILMSEILNYRKEIEECIERYFSDHIGFFNESFASINEALKLNDTDGFIRSANALTQKLGNNTRFETFAEFKNFMNSEEKFNL